VIGICGAELPDSLEELLEEREKKGKRGGKRRASKGSSDGSSEKEDRQDRNFAEKSPYQGPHPVGLGVWARPCAGKARLFMSGLKID
jgi:hypothetical protein